MVNYCLATYHPLTPLKGGLERGFAAFPTQAKRRWAERSVANVPPGGG